MDFKVFNEIFIAVVVILYSVYIVYRKLKNNNKQCDRCGSCSKMCPNYKDREKKH